jgi:hypothetical protein
VGTGVTQAEGRSHEREEEADNYFFFLPIIDKSLWQLASTDTIS